ncbi:MAG: hypothetical protein IJ009_04185 [Clostridia bacterium]|nr:hypothetical protein [Clostridia bacterium]
MDKNQEKTKQSFSNVWKKMGDFGKKAAEETKKIVDQTKENIHEKKAKKYTVVTLSDFEKEDFKIPSIIKIEDDSANREFIEDAEAMGWIELHKEVPAFHIYSSFVEKCGLVFIPVPQRDNVYCQDNFNSKKYINSNQVFGKATEEKLAELNNIAYCLGAKSCSVEIFQAEKQTDSNKMQVMKSTETGSQKSVANKKSGKRISYFEGHDEPKAPQLKWFAYDENVKNLIEMRCNKAIKSTVLELNGSSCASMSRSIACAVDDVLGIGGKVSMEKQATKELNDSLLFEIEF